MEAPKQWHIEKLPSQYQQKIPKAHSYLISKSPSAHAQQFPEKVAEFPLHFVQTAL